MDIHIGLDQLGLLVSIVVLGVISNWYCLRKGHREGWDDLAYFLEEEGLIDIDAGGEIKRISDREFQKRKAQLQCEE